MECVKDKPAKSFAAFILFQNPNMHIREQILPNFA